MLGINFKTLYMMFRDKIIYFRQFSVFGVFLRNAVDPRAQVHCVTHEFDDLTLAIWIE